MSNNVNDILKQLNALNISNSIDVYIPSLEKTIKFKNLNLKQQKELLKSSIDETLTRLTFINNFYNIIEENALEPIDVANLFVFDRFAIAVALRAAGLNSNYTIDSKVLDLKDILNQINKIEHNKQLLSTTISIDNITLKLEAPTLGTEREVSIRTALQLKDTPDKDVKTIIGELFVYEIIKYIDTITFFTSEGEQTSSFKQLTVEDRLAVAEKLPSTLISKILDFIKIYRAYENSYITYNEVTINIDSSFFSI